MPRLKWVIVNEYGTPWLKASNVINLDITDLCAGRSWGGNKIYIAINFSIHERKSVGQERWTHQLLAPNGVHIYLHSVEEGKVIAETIYARILASLCPSEKLLVKALLRNKTKHKKAKLEALLKKWDIRGEVYYSNKFPKGWMHVSKHGWPPQRLGFDYAQAVELIESGTLNFLNLIR